MKTDRIGKGSLLALALMALLSVAAVTVPSTSWFRVAGNNAGVGLYLQCTNLDGSAQWAEVPARFSFLWVTNTIVTSNIFTSYITVTNTASISNIVIPGADGSWLIYNRFSGDNLVITNPGTAAGFVFNQTAQLELFYDLKVDRDSFVNRDSTVGRFLYVTNDIHALLDIRMEDGNKIYNAGQVYSPLFVASNNVVYAYAPETIATNSTANSNLTVNFGNGANATRELIITNGISLTNYTGMAAGLQSSAHWTITPSGNQNVVWPAAGASFSIFRYTNSASPLWTTLTNGVRYRLIWEGWGTNINMTIAAYQ